MLLSLKVEPQPTVSGSANFSVEENNRYFNIVNTSGEISVSIKNREKPPLTYCSLLERGFKLGYGDKQTETEFLSITYRDEELYIERDIAATLPLFYGYVAGLFILSDNYAQVVKALPKLTPCYEDFVKIITPHSSQRPTIWNEVSMLGSGEALLMKKGTSPRKEVINQRSWGVNGDLTPSNPVDFHSRLDDILDKTLQKYANTSLAFELSGGLDSSTLPLFMADQYSPPSSYEALSAFYSGMRSVSQVEKIKSIIARLPRVNLRCIKMDSVSAFITDPFTSMEPFPPDQNPYYSLAAKEASVFREKGVDVVFHGNGGDELFEHTVSIEEQLGFGERVLNDTLTQLPDYCTIDFQSLLGQMMMQKSLPSLPRISTSITGGISMSAYTDQDIWPVSPFIDAELYDYCQALPWQFRDNKQILRYYYEAKQFPKVIYGNIFENEQQAEELGEAMVREGFAEIVLFFADNSVLHELGFIDKTKLIEKYTYATHNPKNTKLNFFWLYRWLALEFNIYLAIQNGQWRL